ncbi:MAG: hypothetical protein HC821_00010 [Lewinella sp.]|nr:hypothetical protein [Lewinella sp.]
MGSKRGVLLELALSRLRGQLPNLKTWGISATIGNLEQALDVLLPAAAVGQSSPRRLIRAAIEKKINVVTVCLTR